MKKVIILEIEKITEDIKKFKIEKPEGFVYFPGQSIDISYDNEKWRDKKRPFSFTSIPSNDYLEFIIKIYKSHNGFTKFLDGLKEGDELVLCGEPDSKYSFKGEGVFIAGGVGITPFLSMTRSLNKKDLKKSKFLYSDSYEEDLIYLDELRWIFDNRIIVTLTKEEKKGYSYGRIDKTFLEKNLNEKDIAKRFYICGPPIFNKMIIRYLEELGVKRENIQG